MNTRSLTPPKISVIIPMRNEENHIGSCLDSILANPFPQGELEILVVDGGSTDRSQAIVADRSHLYPCIRYIDNPERIVSTALNRALAVAAGETIIIMGAHAEYSRNYIAGCVRELDRTKADVVGGRLITKAGAKTRVASAIALATQHPFGIGGASFRTGNTGRYVDTVPYGAYRREIFELVGNFDESLARNQDFEFNSRVRGAGGRLYLSSAIHSTYYNVPTVRRFILQAWGNARWLAPMWISTPISFRWRHAVPLVFVLLLLLSAVFSVIDQRYLLIGAGALGLYLFVALTAATRIAKRHGSHLVLLLPSLFLVYHIAYGLGTAAGFVLRRGLRGGGSARLRTPICSSQ